MVLCCFKIPDSEVRKRVYSVFRLSMQVLKRWWENYMGEKGGILWIFPPEFAAVLKKLSCQHRRHHGQLQTVQIQTHSDGFANFTLHLGASQNQKLSINRKNFRLNIHYNQVWEWRYQMFKAGIAKNSTEFIWISFEYQIVKTAYDRLWLTVPLKELWFINNQTYLTSQKRWPGFGLEHQKISNKFCEISCLKYNRLKIGSKHFSTLSHFWPFWQENLRPFKINSKSLFLPYQKLNLIKNF